MTHLYDTDHISIIQTGTGPEFTAIMRNAARHPTADVGYPVVSFPEQAVGADTRISRARTPADVLRGYALFARLVAVDTGVPLVPFDAAAQLEFDQLRARKVRIGTPDLRLAATAKSRNLNVVTRNVSDFGQVPGLVTEDWTK